MAWHGDETTKALTNLNEILAKNFHNTINDMHHALTELNPSKPETLTIVLTTLLAMNCEQQLLAKILGTSRTQIARWSKGVNHPKQPGFRAWLVGELLNFMKQQFNAPKKPILIKKMNEVIGDAESPDD